MCIFRRYRKIYINTEMKNLEYPIKLAYSRIYLNRNDKGIVRIEDSVYNIPFIFAGPSTWEAREFIEKNPILIKQ